MLWREKTITSAIRGIKRKEVNYPESRGVALHPGFFPFQKLIPRLAVIVSSAVFSCVAATGKRFT
jgi:hypothetical protein